MTWDCARSSSVRLDWQCEAVPWSGWGLLLQSMVGVTVECRGQSWTGLTGHAVAQ